MRNTAAARLFRCSSLESAFAIGLTVLGGLTMASSSLGQDSLRQGNRPSPPGVADADRLGQGSIFGDSERMPLLDRGEMTLPPLMAATTNTAEIGNGVSPKEFRSESEVPISDLPESGTDRDTQWIATNYSFAAANTFSHPRYFEDRMLERHGHERFPHLQPLVSGARFFATFPMLPYLMTVRPPCECESQLGYFRSGSCVYPYAQRPPYQRDAVIVEAAAVTGAIIAIP